MSAKFLAAAWVLAFVAGCDRPTVSAGNSAQRTAIEQRQAGAATPAAGGAAANSSPATSPMPAH